MDEQETKNTAMNKYSKEHPYHGEIVNEAEFKVLTPKQKNELVKLAQEMERAHEKVGGNGRLTYETEIRRPFNNPLVKVFLTDDSLMQEVKGILSSLKCVKNINITPSNSDGIEHDTLTVYPRRPFKVEDVEKEIKQCLDNYEQGVTVNDVQISSEVHFKEQERKIIDAINKAGSTIDVCMAWFTNENILKALEDKQKEGIKVRVIIFKDGVNGRHGVDLTNFEHKELRGERGGIMHNKFCVIDNWIVINGSYNWTIAAETRNDENAQVEENNKDLANKFTKEFNDMWDRQK